jgi:UDP-N-acetylmuramate: L-alanyl-gamma-D-glutamyl-meso-diaminopimelate ligase
MINHDQHIHFIAIGGSAMHNLAIALHQTGYFVTGSDDDIFEPSRSRLSANGLLPAELGWHPEKISRKTKAVILGMHARIDNPELKRATDLGIRIYSFPDFVFQSSKNAKRVVIAGSHGKTTITSIIMHVLRYAGKEFDYLVGAGIEGFSNMVKLNGAPIIVLEGDEYLSSALDKTPKFIRYNHDIGLISGIAWDHINAFPSKDEYIDQFSRFIDNTPDDGCLVYFDEDPVIRELLKGKKNKFRIIPYSTPIYIVRDGQYYLKNELSETGLRLFGKHNMQNLAGAMEVLKLLGLPEKDIFKSLRSFDGAANRLEKLFDDKSIVIYKDFAHSPSKLKSTVEAVHELYPEKKIISCFELHTYSSLNKDFLGEYRNSFPSEGINMVFVNDHTLKIKKMPPLSDEAIKTGFNNDKLTIIRSKQNLENLILDNIQPDTVLLFMSSGNFGEMNYSDLIEKITQQLP